MNAALNALVESWERHPDEKSTISLCEQLGPSGETRLVDLVGKRASIKFASNPTVLVAIARMYVAGSRLGEAQGLLVSAGKMAPRDPEAFRWLEVLPGARRGAHPKSSIKPSRSAAKTATRCRGATWPTATSSCKNARAPKR
jgi:hypothetical protein